MSNQQIWFVVGVISLTAAACSSGADFPADAKTALEKAEQWELLSLDPKREKEPPKDGFHGWKVLGKTTIKDGDTRKKLLAALVKGANDNKGIAAACFSPRHGIRVTVGDKTTDLVICFECYSASVFTGDEKAGGYLTTGSPQPALDKVLTDAKVPLPKKDE